MQRPLQRRWPSVPGESWLRRLRIALPPLVVMSAAIRCRVTSVRACEFTGCLPAGRARAPAAPTACWTRLKRVRRSLLPCQACLSIWHAVNKGQRVFRLMQTGERVAGTTSRQCHC